MTLRVRKLALTLHVILSVGWIGAVAAYITLDVAATTSADAKTLRAAYLALELISRRAIVPLALGSLLTGLVMSFGTKWGLFRHYWVLISFILTVVATLVLLIEIRTISYLADVAAAATTSTEDLAALGGTLPHSVGGIVVLMVILVLNTYKPKGMTPYGWRRQKEQRRKTQEQRESVERAHTAVLGGSTNR